MRKCPKSHSTPQPPNDGRLNECCTIPAFGQFDPHGPHSGRNNIKIKIISLDQIGFYWFPLGFFLFHFYRFSCSAWIDISAVFVEHGLCGINVNRKFGFFFSAVIIERTSMDASKASRQSKKQATASIDSAVALDGKQCQAIVAEAIEQYTDRHNFNFSEQGAKDLKTLSGCNPSHLHQVFNSSVDAGLPSNLVEINGSRYGINEYKKRKRRTLGDIFKEAISDEMLIILMVAAVVSIVVEYFAAEGEEKDMFWVDGVSILIAVVVCSMVSTISNYEKQKQFDELDQMTENTYNYEVLRDGKRVEVHRTKIVPGDMILISNGLEVPADCIIFKAVNVIVNESAITGESHELEKNVVAKCMEQRMDPKGATPFLVSGSTIVSGEGLMMAVVVGKDSRAGKNFQLIFSKQDDEDNDDRTPLEIQLENLANQIGHFGLTSAVFIFLVLFIRLLVEELEKGGFDFKNNLNKIVNYLIIAVTVVVVAIPEGLPLAVTLTLAYSMKAMHEDKILVRKLASCETMGAATFICSDKTGTITQNKMNVMHIVNQQGIPVKDFTPDKLHKDYVEKLTAAIFHNTSAVVDTEKGPQTEVALLKFVRKLTGKNENDARANVGSNAYWKRLPFDSNRKRMTTGMTIGSKDILFMNGASQQILEACIAMQSCYNSQIIPINSQAKLEINRELEAMAGRGLRTVSIAYKEVSRRDMSSSKKFQGKEKAVIEEVEKNGFTLLGVFGIEDPPREESKSAIQNCHRAGIKVIMVTGDNKITAANIAKQVGIVSEDGKKGKILEASEFIKALEDKGLLKYQKASSSDQKSIDTGTNKMKKVVMENQKDIKAFKEIVGDLVVMARSKPEHKYVLVDGINKLGHIVGVTGDGANDAPALMRADIGMAMGITGTQVSKNASDIILLDDNFQSIVRAVVWGRNVYLSIRKFLQFQLTVNIIAVCISLISAAVIRQAIFPSVQMLWVNLIMDSLAALALATEPPNRDELINQKPNSPDQKLITKTMLKHIIGQALFQLTILLFLLFCGQKFIPEFKDGYDNKIGSDLAAKYYNGIAQGTVSDGKMYTTSGQDSYNVWFKKYQVFSRHITFIFNTFVFLQVFNFICCRRIKDELNFFNRICASKLFWIIVFAIVVLQVLVITFGGRFFQVYNYHGLTPVQWVMSVGIAALTLPYSILLRILPIAKPSTNTPQKELAKQATLKYNKESSKYEQIN